MASKLAAVAKSGFSLKRWVYNASGFNKYGLMHDDCLYEDEDVTEALRRCPQDIIDERNYRTIRAMQLSLQKIYLPKDQWTKYEEDVRYLQPYLEEVKRENAERAIWEKNH